MLRAVRWISIALIVVLGAVWAAAWFGRRPGESMAEALARGLGMMSSSGVPSAGTIALPPGVEVGGPFTLTDHTGARVTDETYRGRFMLVFFGFTHCPDVCPTELQKVAAALDALGAARAARIAPIFISVDHERDGPEQLADYVRLFDDRVIGLSGTEAEIAAAARRYRVYYARVTPPGSSTFLYDHSSFLYLMGPDGRFRAIFPPTATAEQITQGVATWLERPGG